MKIIFADVNKEICAAWLYRRAQSYAGDPMKDVEIVHGSILDVACDAVVSPANSFGFMDGGIDQVYTDYFGLKLQIAVQATIVTQFNGELLVGQAFVQRTGHEKIPFCVAAPTMRVPLDIRNTINAFLATRAAVSAALRFGHEIRTLAIPGMGTGVGLLPAREAAHQMARAIADGAVSQGGQFALATRPFPASLGQAQSDHRALRA